MRNVGLRFSLDEQAERVLELYSDLRRSRAKRHYVSKTSERRSFDRCRKKQGRRKPSVLESVNAQGNISKAWYKRGYSDNQFYDYKRLIQTVKACINSHRCL